MNITREYLEQQIAQLQAQAAQHLASANAANGAIELARHLLAMLPPRHASEITVAGLEAMTGGKVDGIEPIDGGIGNEAVEARK